MEKNKKLLYVIIILLVIIMGLLGGLILVLSNNMKSTNDTTGKETVASVMTTEKETETIAETTKKKTVKKRVTKQKTTEESHNDFDSIIKAIKDNYYGIQNNLGSFTKVNTQGSYQRWDDQNGVMRKIVLPPNADEFRTMTNEYYYDENGMFQFAFLYDGQGNEYRYYFYNNKVYRYIAPSGQVTDYKNGEDPYVTEEIGSVYSNGEREKHF